MAAEAKQELFVRQLLEARFGIVLRKIPERLDEQTPGYELLADGACAAVIEVKTLERTPRTPENGWEVEHVTEHTWKAERVDDTPARVGALVHKAANQLRSYTEPKLLVIFGEEDSSDMLDLEEAVQGFLPYGTAETGILYNTASMKIAEGRIRDDRWLIDLYIWIEPTKGRRTVFHHAPTRVEHLEPTDETVQFRVTSEAGLEIANRFFGMPADLPRPAATRLMMPPRRSGGRSPE